ncbi:hypothetical protein E1A91_A05G198300v1 [Gossypium mustelinum]|uniref:Uncharacterized protein n=1 Tax=Gossypium mustelinum TaxID=34275 RepID=A0A5D2Z9L4_GOSMU|nr:hypothetical protein E1A91_A05G198300v1 [Gossypium mustelinum]
MLGPYLLVASSSSILQTSCCNNRYFFPAFGRINGIYLSKKKYNNKKGTDPLWLVDISDMDQLGLSAEPKMKSINFH